jgi:hypothetical protein
MNMTQFHERTSALIVFSAMLFAAPVLQAQNFAIDWFTIDGGGGASTADVYAVSGTIGQPDAGTMSGGNFKLDGGFWGIIGAVQTPGAPLLTITASGANVIISWPSPSPGFALEQNSVVGTTNWSSVGQVPDDNGTRKSIVLPASVGNRFYRLKR